MLIRISLIIAIVGALAAGILNIAEVRVKINTLMSQRDSYHSERDTARTELASTKRTLASTEDTLKQTKQDLVTARSARDKAVADAATQLKRADQLSDKLAQTTKERNDAQNQLAAYTATGFTSDQVSKLSHDLKNAQDALQVSKEEKIVLTRTVARLDNKLNELIGTNYVVTLPANLKGKILVVDPKWDFVVLNIGAEQGVLQDGQLLVSRDGKLVSKVIVRSVEKNRCIANIMPGWELGQVIEGDEVTPANPASS
jgi:hypothetical protein